MANDRSPEPKNSRGPRRLLQPASWTEARTVAEILRMETVGGALLLLATIVALAWANSPWSGSYEAVSSFVPWPGGAAFHLNLNISHWTMNGLLAIFFFVVGLELKREFLVGDLRHPHRALLPVVAAVCGMVLPAVVYVAITFNAGGQTLRGWAIPTATDIAFALAVLAIINSHLPNSLRAFLLTLAVVDDLLAIAIIALFYTSGFQPLALVAALVPLAVFGLLAHLRKTWWWALVPLALLTWLCVNASGVHATIAGVLLGFAAPVLRRGQESSSPAELFEHTWRPISAGVAVPLFALFAAGVSLRGQGLLAALTGPVALGIVAGLVLGKTVGIFGSSFVLTKFTRAEIGENVSWWDLLGISLLAGIGFTVSLLLGELALGEGSPQGEHARAAILAGSLLAALLASVVLTLRNRTYRRLEQQPGNATA